MKYWWVNQNQTFRQELELGCLWSPKKNRNGRRNHFYDNMTKVRVGDPILSFTDTWIKHLCVAKSAAISRPKPSELADVNNEWSDDGWFISVDYRKLSNPVKPSLHMGSLSSLLPSKYSPLQPGGRGNQAYLFELDKQLFNALSDLSQGEINSLLGMTEYEHLETVEEDMVAGITERVDIPETTKLQLIRARIGQGVFRSKVLSVEPRCRLTRISDPNHLIASHIKPWRDSSDQEKLDGNNGLMLSPHVDHLFDKGLITFSKNGDLVVSDQLESNVLRLWNIDNNANVGTFSSEQERFLMHHRNEVFKS